LGVISLSQEKTSTLATFCWSRSMAFPVPLLISFSSLVGKLPKGDKLVCSQLKQSHKSQNSMAFFVSPHPFSLFSFLFSR
jgi:hypothetical protein